MFYYVPHTPYHIREFEQLLQVFIVHFLMCLFKSFEGQQILMNNFFFSIPLNEKKASMK